MLTDKKDVRHGQPVWKSYSSHRLPVSKLPARLKTDILIIGAGISGALMAEALTGLGFSVALLDRRGAGKGSTPATTALLQYELDVPLSRLRGKIGEESAARAWRRSRLAVSCLADRTRFLDIACELEANSSLYLSGNVLDAEGLRRERQARRDIGLESEFLTPARLQENFGISRHSALESHGNFVANPVLLTQGYLAAALHRRARLYYDDVEHLSASAQAVHVQTKKGAEITARHLVFCAGYEVPEALQDQEYRIFSTWAIATRTRALKRKMPMIWEASDPYLYLRQTPEGRVICGGEDEKFLDEDGRNAMTPKKTAVLERKMNALLKLEAKADYAWTGSFGVTPTGMPLIGAVPRLPNCSAVLAFGGNGIVHSRIGADIISAMISGRDDPEADLYAFQQHPRKAKK
jgi:glycine/D-amino acid oxidase-like deaminating enzyme